MFQKIKFSSSSTHQTKKSSEGRREEGRTLELLAQHFFDRISNCSFTWITDSDKNQHILYCVKALLVQKTFLVIPE
jgi:hypothetical protein